MDYTTIFNEMMSVISPVLVTSGMLSLTIAFITMLINMIINAATGKGFTIGLR